MNRGRRFSDKPWQQPYPLLIAGAALLSGGGSLVLGQTPGSLDALLPKQFDILWASLLVLGGVIDLTGLFWRGHISTSLLLRCCGLIALGGALVTYGPAIFWVGRQIPGAFVPATILTGYGLACWAQCALLFREEQRITLLSDKIDGGG